MYDTGISYIDPTKKSTIHVGKDTIPIDPSWVHIILDFLTYIRCLEKIKILPQRWFFMVMNPMVESVKSHLK